MVYSECNHGRKCRKEGGGSHEDGTENGRYPSGHPISSHCVSSQDAHIPASGAGETVKELMTTEQLLQGLKHYRRIARQDLLRAPETPHPDAFRLHAEARRALYVALEGQASEAGPQDAIDFALEQYRSLPFTTGTAEHEHPGLKGRENGLENFFLMIGLDPKMRREARNARPKLLLASPEEDREHNQLEEV